MAMSAEILYNAAHLHAIIAFEKAFNRWMTLKSLKVTKGSLTSQQVENPLH